jgi:hypothetical protein
MRPIDRQPRSSETCWRLRPLTADDYSALYGVASDPLIWEQHPERHRYEEPTFRVFFEDAPRFRAARWSQSIAPPAESSDRRASMATMRMAA